MDQYYFESGYFTPENYFSTLYDAVVDMRPYVEDYVGEDYVENPGVQTTFTCELTEVVVVIVEASADLTSTTSVSAVASRTITGASTMSSAFSQTAVISHIEGADLFAMSNASLAAEVARIRDNNIDITSAFTQVVSGAKFMYVGSDQTAEFAITADNLRVRFNEAAIDAAFSLAADVEVTQGGETVEASGTWTVTASQTAINDTIRYADSSLTAAFEQTTQLDITLEFVADLTATAQVTATISHIEGADLTAFTDVSLSAQAEVLRGLESALEVTTAMTTVSGNVEEGEALLASTTDITAVAINLGVLASNLTSTTEVTATISHIESADLTAFTNTSLLALGNVTRELDAVLESTTEVGALISHTESASASMSSSTSQTADVIIVADINLALTATSEVIAVISHIEGADLTAFTNTALAALGNVTRGLASDLTATSEQTATALRIQDTSAAVESVVTASIAGNKIRYGASAISASTSLTATLQKIIPNYNWEAVKVSGFDPTLTFNSTGRQQPTTSGASYDITAFRLAGTDSSINFNLNSADADSRDLLTIGTKNATIEFWYSRTANTNSEQLVFQSGGISLYYAVFPQAYRLTVTNGSSTYQASYTGGSLPLTTQRHIAVVRNGTAVNLYLAGTQRISVTIPSNFVISQPDISASVSFTDNISNATGNSTIKVDEFRYSVGSARYTSTYTPPTTAFTKDAYTRALSHFDNTLYVIPSAVQATGAFTSYAQVTANANKFGTVQAAADLTSTTAVSALLSRNEYAAADLQVQAFTVTVNARIVPEQASLESAFFLSVSLAKIKNAESNVQTAVSADITGDRIRFGSSTQTSAFTSTTSINRIRAAASALTSAFSQSTVATEIRNPLGNSNWYKGIQGDSVLQARGAVYIDPYVFELGYGRVIGSDSTTRDAYILVKREIDSGRVVWKKSYYGTVSDVPYALQQYNGYIYAVFGQNMAKIDPEDGQVINTWAVGVDYINDFVISNDYIYISGSQGTANAAIAKYSLTGTKQWSKRIDGTTRYYLNGLTVRVVGSDIYWLYTRYDTVTSYDNIRLVKLSTTDGSITWAKTTGFIDSRTNMTVGADGTAYMIGRTDITDVGVFVKIDSSGALLGTPKHLANLSPAPFGWIANGYLEIDNTNSAIYLVADNYNASSQVDDSAIVKLTLAGAVTWSRKITTPGVFSFVNPHLTDASILFPGRYVDGSNTATAVFNVPFDGGNVFSDQKLPTPFTGNWSWIDGAVTSTDSTYTDLATVSITTANDTNTNVSYSVTVIDATNTDITYLYNVICYGAFQATTAVSATAKKTVGLVPTNLSAQFSITPRATKAVLISSNVTVTASQTTQAIKQAEVASTQQATASLTANNARTRRTASVLSATSVLTANAIKTARTSSTNTVSTELTAAPYDFTQAQAALSTTCTLAVSILKIQTSAVTLEAFDTQVTAAAKIGVGLLAMDANFTSSVIATKSTDTVGNLQATAQMVTNNVFLKNVTADLASEVTVTAAVDKIKRIEVTAESTADLTAVADVTRTVASAQEVSTSLNAVNTRGRSTPAQLQATASLSLDITVLVEYQASLTSQATTVATAYNLVSGTATMSAFDTMLTVGTRIRFDPYYTLQVKSESRALIIHEETRVLAVESETRVNIIKGRE